MNSYKTPLEIMGLKPNATQADIKARYRQLALKHHPDRHSADSADVKAYHEKEFKIISEAYELANSGKGNCLGMGEFSDANIAEEFEKWKKVWDQFVAEDGFGKIKNLLKDTLHVVRDYMAVENDNDDYNSDDDEPLTIRIYVSLEDVHSRKIRKVRINTKSSSFCVHVNCGDYPVASIRDKNIRVNIHLKKHDVYHLDSFMGNKDLYCSIDITLDEYFKGTEKELIYLDGSIIKVPIPAFRESYDAAIWIDSRGLHGEDSLYVMPRLVLPKNTEEVKGFLEKCRDVRSAQEPSFQKSTE